MDNHSIHDNLLLECIEDTYRALETTLKKVRGIRSVHVFQLERWAEELRSQRRIFEEISFPARLIVEHLMECQSKNGQVALEAEHLNQSLSSVRAVTIEKFGIIKVTLGELEISWRDDNYSYYFYPDKVELRAIDEKSAIKLFFSLGFSRQLVEGFPELFSSPNVIYIHPQIEEWLKKVL